MKVFIINVEKIKPTWPSVKNFFTPLSPVISTLGHICMDIGVQRYMVLGIGTFSVSSLSNRYIIIV